MKKEFQVHKLNQLGLETAKKLGEEFSELLELIERAAEGGDGRCLALARTKLEEACFYAKKAMATRTDLHAAE